MHDREKWDENKDGEQSARSYEGKKGTSPAIILTFHKADAIDGWTKKEA